MGGKAGRRNSKIKCRGAKGSSGSSGAKPGRANFKKKLKRVVRKIRLRQTGIEALVPPEPIRCEEVAQEGRNELCHCGSGKKFKRCCSS